MKTMFKAFMVSNNLPGNGIKRWTSFSSSGSSYLVMLTLVYTVTKVNFTLYLGLTLMMVLLHDYITSILNYLETNFKVIKGGMEYFVGF